jgi:hypothetical protein
MSGINKRDYSYRSDGHNVVAAERDTILTKIVGLLIVFGIMFALAVGAVLYGLQ